MAVTLFHKYHIVINNKVTIVNGNGEQENPKPQKVIPQAVTARIRGKMYGRRTINR